MSGLLHRLAQRAVGVAAAPPIRADLPLQFAQASDAGTSDTQTSEATTPRPRAVASLSREVSTESIEAARPPVTPPRATAPLAARVQPERRAEPADGTTPDAAAAAPLLYPISSPPRRVTPTFAPRRAVESASTHHASAGPSSDQRQVGEGSPLSQAAVSTRIEIDTPLPRVASPMAAPIGRPIRETPPLRRAAALIGAAPQPAPGSQVSVFESSAAPASSATESPAAPAPASVRVVPPVPSITVTAPHPVERTQSFQSATPLPLVRGVHSEASVAPAPAEPPTIHVTIGRIDVRASTPTAAPASAPPRVRLTLDDYLEARSGRRS